MVLSPRGVGGAAIPPGDEAITGQGSNRAQVRAGMLEEVVRGWERPVAHAATGEEPGPVVAATPLARKLETIVLPGVSFTRAGISEVVAALIALAEEYDPAESGMKGVNIVLLDPGGSNPRVTLALRQASLKRVLDFVTEAIGYQYETQVDAVVVRPGGEISNLQTRFFPVTRATVLRMTGSAGVRMARNSRGPQSDAGTGVSADDAGAMRDFLQQAGVNFAAEGASLAYDGAAIIVTQTTRNLDRIRNILARYSKVRQVEIEAKFMEVQEGALEELGVEWNVARRGQPQLDPVTGAPVLDASGRQVFVPEEVISTVGVTRPLWGAFPSTSNNRGITIDTAAVPPATINGVVAPGSPATSLAIPVSPAAIPGGVALGNTANALGSLTGIVGEFDVAAVVPALAQQQGTDLLSSPRITVMSGNPATITVAQEMRYPQSYGEIQSQVGSGTGAANGTSAAGVTITSGTPQEFTTRNVGVELKVTPTVEEDDYSISLDLNPRVTEFEGFVEYGGPSIAISSGTTVTVPPGFYQPIFSVRDISTRVTLWDGATLVMGGLTREEVRRVHDKVPVLGDIPLLGRLFRSQAESSQKRNLLIFVTANLVSPGGSLKRQPLPGIPAGSPFRQPAVSTPAGTERRP